MFDLIFLKTKTITFYTIICEVIFRNGAFSLKVRLVNVIVTLNEFLYIFYCINKNEFILIISFFLNEDNFKLRCYFNEFIHIYN